MPEFLLATPDLSGADQARVAAVLEQLRGVPALAERYRAVGAVRTLADLARVPVLAKDDLQAALAHRPPRAEAGATWLFQSGGSTGSPQVGYAPTGLYMAEVYAHWRALSRDDVFVNGWSAGKMWGAHFLVNAYADLAGCLAMNLGAMSRDEYDPWLQFFATWKVTAYGGTPSVLRLVFGHAAATGVKLPDLRAVLWLGEAWDPQLDADLAAVAPQARRWGMFGSTETWVVATNTPDCPADVWHPLPSQLVCVDEEDELLDFTCLNPQVLNPVLRYRTGDAGQVVDCACGNPAPALRVLGRRDNLIKFRGHLLNVDDLVADLDAQPGVARSQLVVREAADGGSVLQVRLLPAGAAAAAGAGAGAAPDLASRVRDHILGSAFGPSIVFQRNPHSLEVDVVDSLIGNERTGKIPSLVQHPAG